MENERAPFPAFFLLNYDVANGKFSRSIIKALLIDSNMERRAFEES
jgi:hypothetical protein